MQLISREIIFVSKAVARPGLDLVAYYCQQSARVLRSAPSAVDCSRNLWAVSRPQ